MIKATGLIFIFIIFFAISNKVYSQTIYVIGKVVDEKTEFPVQNATISVYNKKDLIYNTISDSAGSFKIPIQIYGGCNRIKIHTLNYFDLSINKLVSINNNLNESFFLGEYKIRLDVIKLNEVKIESKRRYRDTTKIDLSKKKFERSIMINDIFSKEYGFTKDANGQLFYKGKPVGDIEVNGGAFFEKNNIDIYNLLPALILNNIQVIETNIDSNTNTTTLKPTIKVNLILKDKYQSGKFGNANLGLGTLNRDMINTNLFTYKNKEQISLYLNSNNINVGDNIMQEPSVNFSANGNDVMTNNARFAYRNVYNNKIEVNLNVNGKLENKNFTSESESQDENINAFSKIFNSSVDKAFNINNAKLSINYAIDSLNTIDVSQTFNHYYSKSIDSSNYIIKMDSLTTVSDLSKLRNSTTDLLNTQIVYKKKFGSKKGRLFSVELELKDNNYTVNELSNVDNTSNSNLNSYFINSKRLAKENIYNVNIGFIEPLGEDSYVKFLFSNEWDNQNYDPKLNSDTIIDVTDAPSKVINQYFKPGIKYQKTYRRFSLDAFVTEILDIKTIQQLLNNSTEHFFNLNADIRVDYKINDKKNLSFNYTDITNYPDIQLLTNLNSAFGLIAQNSGNINLKPEQKKSIKLSYNTRSSDNEVIGITGEFYHFDQKFGLATISSSDINSGNILENNVEENIGSSNGTQVSFSILKNIFKDKYLNFSTGIAYQQSPTVVNNKLILNNGISFNQSLSTSIIIIQSLLITSPIVTASYSKYFYETNSTNITTLSYSDKLSLSLKLFQLNIYPLINYNHSIGNNSSFSMNGEVKKNILKDYGSIWIQAYDIFNSFKFINNYVNSYSYTSVKYSNLNRYILLGISFKFNNMK